MSCRPVQTGFITDAFINASVITNASTEILLMSKKKTRPGYRDSGNGQFISEQQANRRKPSNWQKESIPLPGRGDTGRGKNK